MASILAVRHVVTLRGVDAETARRVELLVRRESNRVLRIGRGLAVMIAWRHPLMGSRKKKNPVLWHAEGGLMRPW